MYLLIWNMIIGRSYDTVVFMECGQIDIEIFIVPNHPEQVTEPEAKGLRHVAFSVESLEEIMKELECEELRTDWFGRRFIDTKDLEGQPIELVEGKQDIRVAKYNTDDKWVQEYKAQFGTEPSFM